VSSVVATEGLETLQSGFWNVGLAGLVTIFRYQLMCQVSIWPRHLPSTSID